MDDRTSNPVSLANELEILDSHFRNNSRGTYFREREAIKRLRDALAVETTGPRLTRPITLYGHPDPDVGIANPECYTALSIGGHKAAILVVTRMADGSPVPPYAQEVVDFLLAQSPAKTSVPSGVSPPHAYTCTECFTDAGQPHRPGCRFIEIDARRAEKPAGES